MEEAKGLWRVLVMSLTKTNANQETAKEIGGDGNDQNNEEDTSEKRPGDGDLKEDDEADYKPSFERRLDMITFLDKPRIPFDNDEASFNDFIITDRSSRRYIKVYYGSYRNDHMISFAKDGIYPSVSEENVLLYGSGSLSGELFYICHLACC